MSKEQNKQKFRKILKEELDRLTVESIKRKDYKTLKEIYILETGATKIEEGKVFNWIKDKASNVADFAKGVADIGITGKGSTNIKGAETLSYKKRQEKRAEGAAGLENTLKTLNSKRLNTLKSNLDSDEFPNSDLPAMFKADIEEIKDVYNQIKQDFESKKINAQRANEEIAALRDIVIYYQDYKISDKYLYLNEQKVFEAEQGAQAANLNAYGNQLPLNLAKIGLSLSGLGILKTLGTVLKSLPPSDSIEPSTVSKLVKEKFDIQSGEGVTQTTERILNKPGFLGADQPASNLADPQVKEFFSQIYPNALAKPELGGVDILKKIVENPEAHGKTVGEVIKNLAKGTETFNPDKASLAYKALMVHPGKFNAELTRTIVDNAEKVPSTSASEMFFKTIGKSTLLALGLGFLGGAATSKIIRTKGKSSSRMATLRNLVDSLVDVAPTGGEEGDAEIADTDIEDVTTAADSVAASTAAPENAGVADAASTAAAKPPAAPEEGNPEEDARMKRVDDIKNRIVNLGLSTANSKGVAGIINLLSSDLEQKVKEIFSKVPTLNKNDKMLKAVTNAAVEQIRKDISNLVTLRGPEFDKAIVSALDENKKLNRNKLVDLLAKEIANKVLKRFNLEEANSMNRILLLAGVLKG